VPGSQSLGRARKNIISENHKCTRVQCQSKSYASKTAEGHSWLLQGGLTFDSASFEIDILTGCGPERVNSSTGSGNSRVDAKSWVRLRQLLLSITFHCPGMWWDSYHVILIDKSTVQYGPGRVTFTSFARPASH
jgi:hypothetical protein